MTGPQIDQAIERVRNGSVDDDRVVVAAYHQRLRAALAGLCPPGVDSDEIAHLAFIEAYRILGAMKTELNDLRFRLLQECVGQLKPEAQAVLDQRYGKDSSVESIARVLGRTAAAVSVQLFALRHKLRPCVERKWRESIAAKH